MLPRIGTKLAWQVGWLEAFGLGVFLVPVTARYALNQEQEEHDAKNKPCQERKSLLDLGE